jgi:hypothetical protein
MNPLRSAAFLAAASLVGPLALASALAAAPQGPPQAGQVFDGFDSRATEDPFAFRRDQRAIWARDSRLLASTHFTGSGGPGGDFDWRIRVLPGGAPTILDTTFSIIVNEQQTEQQVVINGQVDVRNLTIDQGATLLVRGPNPVRITASGTVRIDGTLNVRGINHPGVTSFNTTNLSSPGAAGGPGGGRGGTGNPLTTQSSPAGTAGFGAFGLVDGGGGGGETGFNPSSNVNNRRGAGGGGGRFGSDVRVLPSGCPDQSLIGLDVEIGGPGAPNAMGALGNNPPQPGAAGPGPFADGDPTNDFWGLMQLGGGAQIAGELPHLWAGAGGGGGGNACTTSSFPTMPWTPAGDEVGSGGGGGGGSMSIFALGDVVFGPGGRLDASGGHGGGGENTSGFNRVGAAGGGGSGGHIVVQTQGRLDFRACTAGTNGARIWSLGGQGGEGMNGLGGAGPEGVPTPPDQDSINLVPPYDPACLPTVPPGVVAWVGSGGDGGPGVVQLHVGDLTDVLVPEGAGVTLASILAPPPIGATDVNDPATWNRLVPSFGPLSRSRSVWMPLGATGPLDLRFAGTDANGRVLTNGTGPNARVVSLAPIASGTIQPVPNVPYVDFGNTLVIDAATIADDVYALNPALLVQAELTFRNSAGALRVPIRAVTGGGGLLFLEVEGAGALTGFGPGDTFELRPRHFRVVTNSTKDWLPGSASIHVTFQGAPANATGGPDTSQASAWTPNIDALESVPAIAFVRFQVDFDMAADGSELTLGSPRPSLEFLRIAWRR